MSEVRSDFKPTFFAEKATTPPHRPFNRSFKTQIHIKKQSNKFTMGGCKILEKETKHRINVKRIRKMSTGNMLFSDNTTLPNYVY